MKRIRSIPWLWLVCIVVINSIVFSLLKIGFDLSKTVPELFAMHQWIEKFLTPSSLNPLSFLLTEVVAVTASVLPACLLTGVSAFVIFNASNESKLSALKDYLDNFSIIGKERTKDLPLKLEGDGDFEKINKRVKLLLEDMSFFYESIDDSMKENTKTQGRLNRLVNKATHYSTSNILYHDLNNILTVVYSDISTMSRIFEANQSLLDKNTKDFDRLKSLRNRLERSTDKISDSVRAQQLLISTENKSEYVDLSELVNQVVFFYRDDFNSKNIRVYKSIQKKTVIYGKNFNLFSVIVNVIKNSIESFDNCYREIERKEISIKLSATEDNIYLAVTDNGSGMTKEVLDSVFKANYSTKKNHVGYGLRNSRKNIDSLGGDIKVTSSGKYKGTSCRIRLPISNPKTNTLEKSAKNSEKKEPVKELEKAG
ncbi:HAMP domain-containing histidine kinase [bacterium]|nr:HAMP domain-containing histidine kinase [bacterium]